MAYRTEHMDAYQSPHESPTGTEGVSLTTVQLKTENKKLRAQNKTQSDEITRLRQQLNYIRKVATPPYKKKRPSKLDLSSVTEMPQPKRLGISRSVPNLNRLKDNEVGSVEEQLKRILV